MFPTSVFDLFNSSCTLLGLVKSLTVTSWYSNLYLCCLFTKPGASWVQILPDLTNPKNISEKQLKALSCPKSTVPSPMLLLSSVALCCQIISELSFLSKPFSSSHCNGYWCQFFYHYMNCRSHSTWNQQDPQKVTQTRDLMHLKLSLSWVIWPATALKRDISPRFHKACPPFNIRAGINIHPNKIIKFFC